MNDFTKYQALGNDYIVIDPHDSDLSPTPEAVRLICDRHFGIGGDGVLFGPVGPVEKGRAAELRIFNSDGSECEKSGNGLRMFALYLAERYIAEEEFVIHTLAGDAPVQVRDFTHGIVRVDMGRPQFDASDVPVLGLRGPVIARPLDVGVRQLTVTCVNIGNPHTVVPLPEISPELAHEFGPAIARHPCFPHGSNVQFLQVIDGRRIRIEIWERGAGYTLASGSSSCAAASAARALGLVGEAVEVQMPGGVIEIGIAADGAVTMTGPARQIATGRFAPGFRRQLGLRPDHATAAPAQRAEAS
jgi:diaminopimelate epimerase